MFRDGAKSRHVNDQSARAHFQVSLKTPICQKRTQARRKCERSLRSWCAIRHDVFVPARISESDFGRRWTFDVCDARDEMFSRPYCCSMEEPRMGRVCQQSALQRFGIQVRRIPRFDANVRTVRGVSGHTAQVISRRRYRIVRFPLAEPRFRGMRSPTKTTRQRPRCNSFGFE